jgi:ABC-type nitrate/sulfonate/bicarbonate transport system substrate-binding protein
LQATLGPQREVCELRVRTVAVVLLIVAAVILLIAWIVHLAPRPGRESPVVRVGYKKNSAYMNLFVAEEKGFFEAKGVTVETHEFEDTNVMLQALVTGQIDATPNSNLEAVCLLEAQAPGTMKVYLVAYWTERKPFSYLLVKKDSKVKAIEELSARKIGTLPGVSPHTWAVMIFRNYFPVDEDKIVALSPNLQLQALTAGQVDALLTVPPLNVIGELKGVSRTIATGLECKHIMDPFPAAGAVISTSILRERPRTSARFVEAMNSAIDFMRSSPDETRAIVAKYTGWEKAVCDRLDIYDYWKLDEIDVEQTQDWLDMMTREQIIRQPMRFKDLLLDQRAAR